MENEFILSDLPIEWLVATSIMLGLVVGSFLNVVIYRLPKAMEGEWRSDCCDLLEIDSPAPAKFNLAFPNSHCPTCEAPIKPWQNIPVLSYLLLRGKCSSCKTSISLRYPVVEIVAGLLSGAIILKFGFSAQAACALLITWALISLTMIDIDTQLLPDSITLPLLWLGLIANAFGVFTTLEDALWGAVAGYLALWSVFWLFKIATGKEGMGYGDFKLLAALGAWMGWQALPVVIILSSFVGAAIGIAGILIMGRDKNIPIPFGPYLAIAGWIALLWGEQLTAYYLQLSGVA